MLTLESLHLATMATPKVLPDGTAWDIDKLRAAMTEANLIVHSPPDIPLDAEVLGFCAVSKANSDGNKYGWIVVDYLAWKTMLHGVGEMISQVSTARKAGNVIPFSTY